MSKITSEIWKAVTVEPFQHLYEVSNRGRVRRTKSGRLLKNIPRVSVGGDKVRYAATLANKKQGVRAKTFFVHRLVALAFVKGDTSLSVNHKDMNPSNNWASNLEWLTHKENIKHAMDSGVTMAPPIGSRTWRKLTDDDVAEIRKSSKMGYVALAAIYKVTPKAIYKVIHRESYRHLP